MNYPAENEVSRRTGAIRIHCMAPTAALVVLTLCSLPCLGVATTDIVSHSLRGQHQYRHHGHLASLLRSIQEPIDEDMDSVDEDGNEDDDDDVEEALDEPKASSQAPLYDDFLDVMNDAAAKALDEQRAIPAYDDFLHLMKGSVEKAYKQQAMPSYDDFLSALKASSVKVLKTPAPSYDDFLNTLRDGAESAMDTRKAEGVIEKHVDQEVQEQSISALKRENPFQRVGRKINEAVGNEKEDGDDDADDDDDDEDDEKEEEEDDENKLREELKRLQKEQKKQHKDSHHKKPLMKRINVLRTQLCWKRPNLWQHEKCMRFLGIHCMSQSTGEGICHAFTKKAKEKCETAPDSNKFKEDYCALAEALGEEYDEEDEEYIEGGEDGDEAQGIEGKGVGSDEDLEKEMAEDAKAGKDTDGDGVVDAEDAFPNDPKEWKDTDKDGIGDNADKDIDGDGHNNDVDAFPLDPKEWKDSDNDGIGDNADKDRDNDGVEDDKDKFPDDVSEWLDSDGDGVGDNKDAYPFNPNCHSPIEPCLDLKKHGEPKPNSIQDPATLDKDAARATPSQGYNEVVASEGPPVIHANYHTWVSDWQDEFPEMPEDEKTTLARICIDHPDNTWCHRFKGHDSHFR